MTPSQVARIRLSHVCRYGLMSPSGRHVCHTAMLPPRRRRAGRFSSRGDPTMPRPTRTRKVDWRCPCSETLTLTAIVKYYIDGRRDWSLHPYHLTGHRRRPAIDSKRCPKCGRDFSQLSVDELLGSVWPGGRAM